MTTYRRVFGLLTGQRRWIALGALLGFVAVGANVALMALSAYLISRAAIVTNVADVALAITGVRVLAISRAAFRYLERYVTHRATFAVLADLRVWFFAAIEPLAPAGLTDRRRGDLLGRIVADIETLEDVPARIIVPPIVAALVTAFASLLLGAFDPVLGLALVGVHGGDRGRPAGRLAAAVARPARTLIATRGDLQAMVVDELDGIADLVALDRAAAHRERSPRPRTHDGPGGGGSRDGPRGDQRPWPRRSPAWPASRSSPSVSGSSAPDGSMASTWPSCRSSRSPPSRSSGRSPRRSASSTPTRRRRTACSS